MNDYNQRTAMIGGISIISIASSATCQIGDRRSTYAVLNALAVQEELPTMNSEKVYFESYPIFDYVLPSIEADYDRMPVAMTRTLLSDKITVGCIDILAASTSASILAGNSCSLTADSRVKHFRKFGRKPAKK